MIRIMMADDGSWLIMKNTDGWWESRFIINHQLAINQSLQHQSTTIDHCITTHSQPDRSVTILYLSLIMIKQRHSPLSNVAKSFNNHQQLFNNHHEPSLPTIQPFTNDYVIIVFHYATICQPLFDHATTHSPPINHDLPSISHLLTLINHCGTIHAKSTHVPLTKHHHPLLNHSSTIHLTHSSIIAQLTTLVVSENMGPQNGWFITEVVNIGWFGESRILRNHHLILNQSNKRNSTSHFPVSTITEPLTKQ